MRLSIPQQLPGSSSFKSSSMGRLETQVRTLCQEPGIKRQTLFMPLFPDGQLRADGMSLLNRGDGFCLRKNQAFCADLSLAIKFFSETGG